MLQYLALRDIRMIPIMTYSAVEWGTLIFGGVQTLVILVGIPIAVRQLRASSKSSEISAFAQISDSIASKERAQRIALVLHLPDDIESWSSDDRWAAEAERSSFEYLGFLVRQGFVRRKLVLHMYSLLIIDIWDKLAPQVDLLREAMDSPSLASSFEWLARQARLYRRKKGLTKKGGAGVLYSDPSLGGAIPLAAQPHDRSAGRREAKGVKRRLTWRSRWFR